MFSPCFPLVNLFLFLSSSNSSLLSCQWSGQWTSDHVVVFLEPILLVHIAKRKMPKFPIMSYNALNYPFSTSSVPSLTFPSLKFVLETACNNSAHMPLFIVFSLLTMPHPHFFAWKTPTCSHGISLHSHLCQEALRITQGKIVAFSLCCFLGLSLPFISHCFYPFEVGLWGTWTVKAASYGYFHT